MILIIPKPPKVEIILFQTSTMPFLKIEIRNKGRIKENDETRVDLADSTFDVKLLPKAIRTF